jgi:hypothetical protein
MTTKISDIKLDDLVESFTFGFGRVVELFAIQGFKVKYPHREEEVVYSSLNFHTLIIHKD